MTAAAAMSGLQRGREGLYQAHARSGVYLPAGRVRYFNFQGGLQERQYTRVIVIYVTKQPCLIQDQ